MVGTGGHRTAAQHNFWIKYLTLRYHNVVLRRTFYNRISAQRSRLGKISLPMFDPDGKQTSLEAWCKQVDSLITNQGHSQQLALMKAVTCLQGRAKRWADNNAYKFHNWDSFQDALVNRFTANQYLIALKKYGHYSSDFAFTYEQYVNVGWQLFSEVLPNAPRDFIMAAVVNGIRPQSYQDEVIRARPRTLDDLLRAVKDFRKPTA